MRNLEKKLESWVQAGLIDKEQAKAIQTHENTRSDRSWAVFGIAAVGVVAIATGLISIIAANWDDISKVTKLSAYLGVLLFTAFIALKRIDRSSIVRELALTFMMLWFLAGLGLVSQIYHLHSEEWRGLAFWCALTISLALIAQNRLASHIWHFGFAATLLLWAFGQEADFRTHTSSHGRLVYISSIPLIFLIGSQTKRAALVSHFSEPSVNWASVGLGLVSIVGHMFWYDSPSPIMSRMPIYTFILVSLATSGSALFLWLKSDRLFAILISAFIMVLCVNVALPAFLPIGHRHVMGAFFFILTWSLSAAGAAASNRRRLFDLCTAGIGVRFIVAYFELFGSLAATGVGLIFSGLIIMGIAWIWHRYRNTFLSLLGEKAV